MSDHKHDRFRCNIFRAGGAQKWSDIRPDLVPDDRETKSAQLMRRADLAMSNAVGGIAVQTLFLAIADVAYRRANLEHAAASLHGVGGMHGGG